MTVRKRVVDLTIGTLLALVALPLVAVLAAGVVLSLKASPFFVQDRVGRGGKPFRFVKLRTLPPGTPCYADKYAIAGVATTRYGRFLRRTHLDELPQLFLVPLGQMSLVGPRPEMGALLARFDPEFVSARLAARPGCTGLWQISDSAGRLIGEAPEYDLHYLEHSGLRMDLWILWRTARSLLFPADCVTLDTIPEWVRSRGVPERTLQVSSSTATR